ncbi:MAG: EutN/CcmL family microcompartment protein [Acetivibrionales bacterium]|jgi:ethanolamine utilization protein EutN
MILARVVGNIVATQKNANLIGHKLLLIQPIDVNGEAAGAEVLAVDGVGAGIGDVVIAIAEGRSARQVIRADNQLAPVDIALAGIVDEISTTKGFLKLA